MEARIKKIQDIFQDILDCPGYDLERLTSLKGLIDYSKEVSENYEMKCAINKAIHMAWFDASIDDGRAFLLSGLIGMVKTEDAAFLDNPSKKITLKDMRDNDMKGKVVTQDCVIIDGLFLDLNSDNRHNYHFRKDPIVRWNPSWSSFSVVSSDDVEFIEETNESEMDYLISHAQSRKKWETASFYEGAIGSEYERTKIQNDKNPFDAFLKDMDISLFLKREDRLYKGDRGDEELFSSIFYHDIEPKLSSKPTPAEISVVKAYRAQKRNEKFGNELSFR